MTEPNFFITSDQSDQHHEENDLHHLTDFDPSKLLDHWLRELDSATMVSEENQ